MHAIDRIHTDRPFYGVRRIWKTLRDDGYLVNRKRVHRLMQLMGLQAIYPRKRLSLPDQAHRVFPYLLREVTVQRPGPSGVRRHHVSALARRLRLPGSGDGLVQPLRALLRVSNSLDASFCVTALEDALAPGTPDIFNTDQGSQFTRTEFTERVEAADIRMSMDGRGRLKDYESVSALIDGVDAYFAFYNWERPHQSFDYDTPAQVYHQLSEMQAAG